MTTFDRPRQIIEYCLKPLGLDAATPEYKEAYARLEHVVKTYQLAAIKADFPVAVDFTRLPTLTINEAAHGHE